MAADQIKQLEREKVRVELLTNTSNIVKEYRKYVDSPHDSSIDQGSLFLQH